LRPVIALAACLIAGAASAHNVGCDGRPVPAHIKAACCGVADAHRVDANNVSRDGSGNWIVANDGRTFTIPDERVEPSPDGCIWLFYSPSSPLPAVYCFLMPMDL